MHARPHFWFDERPFQERRKAANALKRATRESEMLEDRQVDYWLELGRTALQENNAARLSRPGKAA